ncbi:Proteasome component C1 [Lachancea thermotolerans]|uniref:KLTH0D00902p n=1 Tax=Lachancea thermotolerans (strain ATCC 56472 / CBS 6340 / NRRL Y-8284) TaxID=559295 RepID=C5DFY3_LACTC|nr:KLTH0D00902p [Lachancea thermotolerans CBS 6340]CAR22325.1 KLTH0D00902p [Lachancea thermotolerans CBS 6340]
MTSIGTGYDLSNSVFSPDGRNFQVEYAVKAAENGATSVGMKFKDGIVLAVEKLVTSKLLVPGKNKKIQTIDRHVGCAYSGLMPDGRHLVNRGREEASSFKKTYATPIPLPALADRLGQYVQAHTLYNSVRPFGITAIVGGVDDDGAHLYMLEPSGTYWGYKGAATGKGRQSAKAELEKVISNKPELDAREAVKEAARIIYLAHEDNKEKDFELEMSWCSISETNGLHKAVPKDLLDEAIAFAKAENGDDSDSDDSSDESENEKDNEKKDAEGDVQLE